jgi:hypothetical protein
MPEVSDGNADNPKFCLECGAKLELKARNAASRFALLSNSELIALEDAPQRRLLFSDLKSRQGLA